MGKTKRKGSKMYHFATVKDGTRTKHDKSCENDWSCPYCKRNRTYKNIKHLDATITI